jgi:hypothetical protein
VVYDRIRVESAALDLLADLHQDWPPLRINPAVRATSQTLPLYLLGQSGKELLEGSAIGGQSRAHILKVLRTTAIRERL